jgi:hypothetical protein
MGIAAQRLLDLTGLKELKKPCTRADPLHRGRSSIGLIALALAEWEKLKGRHPAIEASALKGRRHSPTRSRACSGNRAIEASALKEVFRQRRAWMRRRRPRARLALSWRGRG